MRIIEQTDGRGRLVGTGLQVALDYTVTISQGHSSRGLGGGMRGRTHVQAQGTIEPTDLGDARAAERENQPLTLELKDGRKLPCWIQRVDGATLTLMPRGELA